MRILAAFFTRKLSLAEAARNFGERFECRFILRLVSREREGVSLASDEATALLSQAESLLAAWRAAIADGTITPAERRTLARELRSLLGISARHASHLHALV